MSSHYKFEVHVKTPGEKDTESEDVREFAEMVATLGRFHPHHEVRVTEVEQT